MTTYSSNEIRELNAREMDEVAGGFVPVVIKAIVSTFLGRAVGEVLDGKPQIDLDKIKKNLEDRFGGKPK